MRIRKLKLNIPLFFSFLSLIIVKKDFISFLKSLLCLTSSPKGKFGLQKKLGFFPVVNSMLNYYFMTMLLFSATFCNNTLPVTIFPPVQTQIRQFISFRPILLGFSMVKNSDLNYIFKSPLLVWKSFCIDIKTEELF